MQISEWSKELQDQRRAWAESLHPDVKSVIGHLHGPLLQKLVAMSNHPDTEYFKSLSAGRPALGQIETAGACAGGRSFGNAVKRSVWAGNGGILKTGPGCWR